MGNIATQDLAFYVVLCAAALSLLMALVNMGRSMRAAGLIVLAVVIALVAAWIKQQDQVLYLYAAGIGAVIAFLFMASSRTSPPSDYKGLSTSGR